GEASFGRGGGSKMREQLGQALGADLDFIVVGSVVVAQPEPDLGRGKPRPVSRVDRDDFSGLSRSRTRRRRQGGSHHPAEPVASRSHASPPQWAAAMYCQVAPSQTILSPLGKCSSIAPSF